MKYALKKMTEIIQKKEAHELRWVSTHLDILSNETQDQVLESLRHCGYSIETTLNVISKNVRTFHFLLDDSKFSITIKYEGEEV